MHLHPLHGAAVETKKIIQRKTVVKQAPNSKSSELFRDVEHKKVLEIIPDRNAIK